MGREKFEGLRCMFDAPVLWACCAFRSTATGFDGWITTRPASETSVVAGEYVGCVETLAPCRTATSGVQAYLTVYERERCVSLAMLALVAARCLLPGLLVYFDGADA